MLELKSVVKQFGDFTAVDNVSFKVDKGEVVGFLGPNGAGKTTTMKIIAGLLEPEKGEVIFDGKNIQQDEIYIKKNLGFMPENNPIYEDMLVKEFLHFTAHLKDISRKSEKKELERVIKAVSIEDVYFKPIRELSKGYRQRVGLAQAIMGSPKLLILDEPTEGLDPLQREEIRDLIRKIGERHTVIISTHVLQEVSLICNRVVIINKGVIVADGSTDDLLSAPDKSVIVFEVESGEKDAIEKLDGVIQVSEVVKKDNRKVYEIEVEKDAEIRPKLYDLAKSNNWRVWELYQKKVSLEDVFKDLTH